MIRSDALIQIYQYNYSMDKSRALCLIHEIFIWMLHISCPRSTRLENQFRIKVSTESQICSDGKVIELFDVWEVLKLLRYYERTPQSNLWRAVGLSFWKGQKETEHVDYFRQSQPLHLAMDIKFQR